MSKDLAHSEPLTWHWQLGVQYVFPDEKVMLDSRVLDELPAQISRNWYLCILCVRGGKCVTCSVQVAVSLRHCPPKSPDLTLCRLWLSSTLRIICAQKTKPTFFHILKRTAAVRDMPTVTCHGPSYLRISLPAICDCRVRYGQSARRKTVLNIKNSQYSQFATFELRVQSGTYGSWSVSRSLCCQ
jgi:ferredoxin